MLPVSAVLQISLVMVAQWTGRTDSLGAAELKGAACEPVSRRARRAVTRLGIPRAQARVSGVVGTASLHLRGVARGCEASPPVVSRCRLARWPSEHALRPSHLAVQALGWVWGPRCCCAEAGVDRRAVCRAQRAEGRHRVTISGGLMLLLGAGAGPEVSAQAGEGATS